MRRAGALLVLAFCSGLLPALARSDDDDARLVRVTPAQAGDQLVCQVSTEGLPGAKQLQSMRSGLVSAVELNLAVIDERDRVLGGRAFSLRMGFDLWEEVFSVRGDGRERRFQNLGDLQSYLADLRDLRVAPSALLGSDARYRLQVGLVVHAIAPDEQQRVEDVIAGEQRPRREGQDQQEASVSLGRLIRFFYKGGRDEQGGQKLVSDWFRRKELPDASH